MLRIKSKTVLGVLLVLGLVLVMNASADTIVVPDDYPTIPQAVAAAQEYDVIQVAAGSYLHTASIDIDKPLTIQGAGRDDTIIEGDYGTNRWWFLFNVTAAADVTFKDLTIRAVNGELIGSYTYGYLIGRTGDVHTSTSDLTVENVHFPAGRRAIFAKGEGLVVRDCLFTGNWQRANIELGGGTFLIENNDFQSRHYQHGALITGGSDQISGVFRNNDVQSNAIEGWFKTAGSVFAIELYNDEVGPAGIVFEDNVFDGAAFDPGLNQAGNPMLNRPLYVEYYNMAFDPTRLAFTGNTVSGYVSGIFMPLAATVTGNDFSGQSSNHIRFDRQGETDPAVILAAIESRLAQNTFDRTVHGAGPGVASFPGLWTTVSGAVAEAAAGDEIRISAGVFEEQVWITKDDLTLVGAGAGVDPGFDTIVRAPVGQMAESFLTGSNSNYPVVGVIGCTGVALEDLRVDGAGRGNANYRFQGVGFWNGGGSLTNCAVVGIQDTPFSGAQHGVGIYAYNDTGGPYAIDLTDVVVEEFQKNGLALGGEGLTVALQNVAATGAGPTGVTAQNGIQIADGAGGTVVDCTIEGVAYTGETWTASGFLVYAAEPVAATGVTVDGSQTSIYWQDASGTFTGGQVINPLGDAFYVYGSGAKADVGGRRLEAQPLAEDHTGGPAKAAIDMVIADSQFVGAGDPGSCGVYAWTSEAMTFAMSGCAVTDWDYGVIVYDVGGAVYDAEVTGCAISGNLSAGLYTNAAETVQASCNWWGDIGGPDAAGNANPAGDAIAGDVIYWPWLDAVAGVCDQYPGDNVSVTSPTVCLTPAEPCLELPVVFNRVDDTASRGVSVTIALSAELTLCDVPTASIVQSLGAGSWSAGFSQPSWQIIDHGDGTYTVDQAILGTPCGPTTGGELFTVAVMSAVPGAEAVGTVTVTDVLVRDCANAPLPGVPGAPGEVVVDLVAPPALEDLTAVQIKTGNPAGAVTRIQLAWSAPGGDTALVHIWRKGYGDYPEYDDAAGAVPTAPVTAANGWQPVDSVSALATDYVDLPATRDFWYYAAYVEDTCGNVSPASSLTSGTLNYHLGDVIDGLTPGVGDDRVDTADISHLGSHYGITLSHGDALNYLDVGPTTDYSVDARPTTDSQVQFEDLMVFAINYDQVSKLETAPPSPAAFNELTLTCGTAGEVGGIMEVSLRLAGDGRVQGVSVPLTWDRTVVEPVGVRAGDLLTAQGGLHLVLSPEPGVVDAALLGVREQGIGGEGTLAVVSFRVKSSGEARIGLGQISARDAQNQAIDLHGSVSGDGPESLPQISTLSAAMPNPFNPSTELSFAIARPGLVKLSVYSLRGQLVTTLVREQLPAGRHTVTWQGTDAAGQTVASGSYIVRLEAPDRTQSRRVMLVK